MIAGLRRFSERMWHWLVDAPLALLSLRPSPTEDDEPAYRPIDLALIRRLVTWLAPYKKRYILGISLGVVMVVLEMQGPQFMQAIIDTTASHLAGTLQNRDQGTEGPRDQGGNLNAEVRTLNAETESEYKRTEASPPAASASRNPTVGETTWRLVRLVGMWAAVLGVALVLQRITILIMTDAGERVQFDFRRRLFAHLQELSMSFYDRTKLGRIISRCTSDVNSLRDINVWGIDTVVKNAVMILIAAGMLLSTEPRLFLAVAWLAPILYFANRLYRRTIAVAHQVAREAYTRVATNLAENITGVRVVTAFNRQAWNLEKFDRLQTVNTANNVNVARITGVYQPLLQLIGFTGKAIILLYGGYLVANSGSTANTGGPSAAPITVGAVVAAFLYWDWLMGPILTFGNFHNQLMMAMAGAERIFSLLDTKPEVYDLPGATPLPRIIGHVRFENVTFGYRPERPVLHEISFDALPGQMIALVGATGGGKSSIISLIARFYQPQSGRILVDGHDTRGVTGDSLHRQMGLVLQNNFLFTGTVMENIRYSRLEATAEDVVRAAKALGSYDAVMSLKDGFEAQVGERGASLSLGQRQLICFTRAFLADPRIFILDEATSAVDTATELLVHRSLMKMREGRTTFVVAHRLSTILRADCIMVIDHGRIIERGRHTDLLAQDGKYARLYRQFVQHVA